MDIFKIFKRKGTTKILEASATLYPDKIVIATTDRVKEGLGISFTNVSLLPVDTDNETLGLKIRHHLSLTRSGLPIPKDYKKAYNEFLTQAGFKNGKDHHKDALHLIISQVDNQIRINPTKNGGYTGKERGFLEMKDVDPIILNDRVDNLILGNSIRDSWSKCKKITAANIGLQLCWQMYTASTFVRLSTLFQPTLRF